MMQKLMVAVLISGSGSACMNPQDELDESDRTSSLALEIKDSCDGPPGDSFTLQQLSIQGHDLVVDVTTGGGCQPHSFSICWDHAVIDTHLPQIELVLHHDAHGDTCDALLFHHLHVDVSSIRPHESDPVILHVLGPTTRFDDPGNSATFTE